jgi:hypothetical protein
VVRLLTYLAGLPHRESPLLFPMYPQFIRPAEMNQHRCRGLHPFVEGRGQVVASLGVEGSKKKGASTCMVRGL